MSGILQTVSQAFSAGQAVAWNVRAAHFRLLAGSAVDVTFFLNGAIVGFAQQVDSGFYLKSDAVFDKVEILSAAAQTVKFTAGSAEAGAASAVSVSGEVAVKHPTVAMTQASLTAAALISSTQILPANSARRFLLIQNNDSTSTVRLNLAGGAAVNTAGPKIPPGGSLLLDVCTPSAAIFAIADTSLTGTVEVVEG